MRSSVINTCLGDGNISVSVVVCSERERLSLLNFKHSVKDHRGMLSSWVGHNCCLWEGIRCDSSTGSVHNLRLRGYNDESYLANDEVNSCLAELRHLKYLDLSCNDFRGSLIPRFIGSFKQLTYLNLSFVGFQGIVPHHIGNLSNLKILDLSLNYELRADDMSWTSGLPSLEHLDLSGLNLSRAKNLEMVFYMIPLLKELSLSECRLSNADVGPFLNSSVILPNLKHLDLAFNSFKGPLPVFLQNMTSLSFLDLSHFNLSLAWNFANFLNIIPSLSELHLYGCGLDKTFLSSPHLNISTLSNIHHLDLSHSFIEGIFPSIFTNMSSLRVLDLSGNQLNSSTPIMSNLQELDLASNQFEQIKHIGIWRQCLLKQLSASDNRFDLEMIGSPENVSECSQYALERLDLSGNLNGTIPESLGRLANLRQLDLSWSSLTSPIPESLGRLRFLKVLSLSVNYLEGVVSEAHFANLSMLKYLDASDNSKLTFNISPEWIPPFQLVNLQLSSCKIANGFPQWLRKQTKLEWLVMSNATISGPLPTWVRKMPIIPYLDLSHNKLIGPLKNLPNKETLPWLDVGSFPKVLLLENNLFNESIPRSLCRRIDLQLLDLSKNRLTGKIPKCLGNLQSLGVMIFSSNRLSGVIPSFVALNLPSLAWLNLNDNKLSGELPRELGNLQNLRVLDISDNSFSGYIPEWIGRNVTELVVLRLHKNNFSGRIPRSLCKASRLQILDVTYNKLTGTIPRCLGELDAMVNTNTTVNLNYIISAGFVIQVMNEVDLEYTTTLGLVYNMDLSSNKLVGEIPVELTTLSMLVGLNLSNNHLSRGIPVRIGNMTTLFSVDLSRNELTGMIPQSMAALTFLSHLNLSDNKLGGQIPTGRQLQTLTDPSIYGGNKGLCGPPLPNKCSNQEHPTTKTRRKKKKEAGEDETDEWLFYLFIMSGFATGFWGVIVVLLFKKEWRRKLLHV